MNKAAIGIGSNQGDPAGICRDALKLLRKHPGIHIVRASSLYKTSPVGLEDQEWFVNAAALLETSLEPQELLDHMLEIEKDFGRVRTVKWGPRTLDLDILFYGSLIVDLPGLKIPHPLMSERLFVLSPLAEIEPGWVHPTLGVSVLEMLDRLSKTDHRQQIERLED